MSAFHTRKAPSQIQRSQKSTSVWVGGRYDEGRKEDYLAAAKAELETMSLPYGYSFDFQSFTRQRQASMKEFWINLSLSLLLIFAVMAGLFESMSQAFAMMVSLPFAVAGAFWTLWATGTDVDPACHGRTPATLRHCRQQRDCYG